MREQFKEVYDKNIWGGSGGGSTPEATVSYRKALELFLSTNNIKTVIDYGCGDWMFSKLIDWSGVRYLGVDCVESVIEKNIAQSFNKENIDFDCNESMSVALYARKMEAAYGSCDLLILKDVLQHWKNDDIMVFLFEATRFFKYILITNTCTQVSDWQDSEDPVMNCRPLSAKFNPLKHFNPKIILNYADNPGDPKEICLLTNLNPDI